jgi:DNA-binding winged helix-turn-helix (wHTH) protein
LRFDRCELRPTERSLRIDGEEVLLGGRAFDLLHTLARRRNQVVSHRELMDSVWPGMAIEPNNLQVQIWALRRLLGAHVIVTVARRGYRIGPEVIEAPPDEAFGTLLPRPDDAETVARVVAALEQHALVTVAAADAAAAHAHATAAARRWAERSRCAVWHVQAHDLHQPDALTERLLGRLSRRADVLVVADAHEAPDSVQGTADRLLHAGRGGRMLVVARRALKLQREHVVQAVATPAPRRSAASAAAASGGPGLRRRQR